MLRQTFNVCTSPVVQEAWANGVELVVHGLVYSLKDGLLRQLVSHRIQISDPNAIAYAMVFLWHRSIRFSGDGGMLSVAHAQWLMNFMSI